MRWLVLRFAPLAWPGHETGGRSTPLGQTHIKQGNRRQGRPQEPRY